ncbi:hypothetical protein K9B32_19995 [Rhizobium sp. 3T7]|uniref:hypothetical protein n=1 Tax=Rhizobium sp. 3T7 TaxID=2874922 RepID=UPI001CCC409E|nr:hypothetical protein [Rhizobium sp. 3T7]MBZ9792371.1 hypothetical protein [Rhizobium sp. 3T7]
MAGADEAANVGPDPEGFSTDDWLLARFRSLQSDEVTRTHNSTRWCTLPADAEECLKESDMSTETITIKSRSDFAWWAMLSGRPLKAPAPHVGNKLGHNSFLFQQRGETT